MTKSNAQKAREAKAKEAEAAAAAAEAEATSEETPAQGSPADLAPLEPPAPEADPTVPTDAGDPSVPNPAPSEDPADEPQPGADEDGFGGDAPVPADETPAENEDASPVGLTIDGPEADEEPEVIPEVKPEPAQPSSVALDAPAPRVEVEDEEDEAKAVSLTEAAAVRLDINPVITITAENGDAVDPDECFTEPDGSGEIRAKVRLIEHATATQFDRPVKVLLIGEGSAISEAGAEKIKQRIRTQG